MAQGGARPRPMNGPNGPAWARMGPAWARMGPHGPAWARMSKRRGWYWNCPCLLKKRARSHTRAATAARDLLLLQHPPALDALAPPLLPYQLLGLAPLLLPMLPIGCWRTLTTLVRQWVQPLFHGLHVSDRGPSRRTNDDSLGRSSRARWALREVHVAWMHLDMLCTRRPVPRDKHIHLLRALGSALQTKENIKTKETARVCSVATAP